MERTHNHNSRVIYVDPSGVRHEALVTAWWGAPGADWKGGDSYGNPPVQSSPEEQSAPGCNLVFISKDNARTDNFGRQLERATSVVHKSRQAAAANFWCWPDEI